MSRMQRTLNQYLSFLESTHHHHHHHHHQPLFLSPEVIDHHQDEFDMPAPDYDQQQQEQLFLAPTLVSYDNNEEDYDDLSNLDDQFMTMEITPYDWPQDLYQTHQPDEALDTETTSFFADSSGSTVFFSDSTASPYGYYNHNSHCNYCDGYDYYDDNDHYDSIGGLIHVFDTPTTPAEYNNPSSSSGPRPQL